MDASQAASKTQFSEKMEVEYKTLFASVGAKYKKEGGHSVRVATKTTSTVVEAKGGSQDIASILSDAYAPTFKTEFKEWLQSIPQYPKAFKFQMNAQTGSTRSLTTLNWKGTFMTRGISQLGMNLAHVFGLRRWKEPDGEIGFACFGCI